LRQPSQFLSACYVEFFDFILYFTTLIYKKLSHLIYVFLQVFERQIVFFL